MAAGSRSPIVDNGWRTEQRGVFAIGNLVHPAETADVCALDGRDVAAHVMDWLALGQWPGMVSPITVEAPLRWAAHSAGGVTVRVSEFVTGRLECRRDGQVVHSTRRQEWVPNRAIHLRVHEPVDTITLV